MPITAQWEKVSRSEPCIKCGKPDFCRKLRDQSLAICRRVDDGTGTHKIDRVGQDYWLYSPKRFSPRPDLPYFPHNCTTTRACADNLKLHAVYSRFLDLLNLKHNHRENLRTRGLAVSEIEKRGYRSLPSFGRAKIATGLVADFGSELCAMVPGLVVKTPDAGSNYWTIAGYSGLVIPLRNIAGQIIALKIRRDESAGAEAGSRYSYVSSTRYGGPGPGIPVHVPLSFENLPQIIRITEGELKADIATTLSGILTLSVGGVSAWHTVLPVVENLHPEVVRIAFDQDMWTNRRVAMAVKQLNAALRNLNYCTEIEKWN